MVLRYRTRANSGPLILWGHQQGHHDRGYAENDEEGRRQVQECRQEEFTGAGDGHVRREERPLDLPVEDQVGGPMNRTVPARRRSV